MDIVEQFYNDHAEEEQGRLNRHRTEFAVSLRVILEHLPPPPCTILDIGGGPGRYSIELASRGYAVAMADLSSGSLALARKQARKAGVTINAYHHCDVRNLSVIPADSFDAALLMGPLYHLQTEADRAEAARNVRRILKPGGIVFAAFITRFAPFRNAACLEPEWLIKNQAYAFEMLETGVHDRGKNFPQAYFAHPDEVLPLMESSGFQTMDLVGCEGIVSGFEEEINTYTGEAWEAWVELNYRLGHEATLYGASDHLLYVGRNPGR